MTVEQRLAVPAAVAWGGCIDADPAHRVVQRQVSSRVLLLPRVGSGGAALRPEDARTMGYPARPEASPVVLARPLAEAPRASPPTRVVLPVTSRAALHSQGAGVLPAAFPVSPLVRAARDPLVVPMTPRPVFRSGTAGALQAAAPSSPAAKASLPSALPPPQPSALPAPSEPLTPAELAPWMHAARAFRMNADFEVRCIKDVPKKDLPSLMAAMKRESQGKPTIQALADKLLLSRLLDNLDVPQMPLLLGVREPSEVPRELERFLQDRLSSGDASGEAVLKPTHLSNGEGVLTLRVIKPEELEGTKQCLEKALRQHMSKKASKMESEALQSLMPGYIAQPKYQSVVGFKAPLELRVLSLWGRVRMGTWWWGSNAPQRNLWICRRPRSKDELSDDDRWEAVHEHVGRNQGFDRAVQLFLQHMPSMALVAEHVATAVGAPLLRCDFFLGSSSWGVRLNEVAYGSGIEYRRRGKADEANGGTRPVVDDAAAVAQILQGGMEQCATWLAPECLLSKIGVRGRTYEQMEVRMLPQRSRRQLPGRLLRALGNVSRTAAHAVPEERCITPPPSPGRSRAPVASVAAAPSDSPTRRAAGSTPAARRGQHRSAGVHDSPGAAGSVHTLARPSKRKTQSSKRRIG